MIAKLTSSLLAVASLSLLAPAFEAFADCEPKSIENHTQFPMRSQLRGHSGTVYLNISIDAEGHATETTLHRSSGHRLLDRAAARSVRKYWVFDVSACERKDLPATRLIAVEYRNAEYGS